MKYSYIVTGNGLYVPQFKKEDGEWQPFKKKDAKGDLEHLCISLGNLSAPRRWLNGQWHFESEGLKDFEHESIFFTKPIYVMAFIGAAQHWFGKFERKEIEI